MVGLWWAYGGPVMQCGKLAFSEIQKVLDSHSSVDQRNF